MSHELEMVNGQAAMAWVGETPWHGLGVKVDPDIEPVKMMEEAQLNWTVSSEPLYHRVGPQKFVKTEQNALVRSSDGKILDYVSPDWNPVQNQEAFEFFNDFCKSGEMKMHTAGSIFGGKVVWALAKVGESFELFGGDKVESYLLFTNPHRFGQSIDIRFTPIRVVCNNTLSMAMRRNSNHMFRQTHRLEFDADAAKLAIGVAADKLAKYKEAAEFLGSKKAEKDNVVEFVRKIFPVYQYKKDHVPTKDLSDNAARVIDLIPQQPGANFAEGSWWSVFNAATYFLDHEVGKTRDNRLSSAWFGDNAKKKSSALILAGEFAEKSPDLLLAA